MAKTIATKRLRNQVRLEATIHADLILNDLLADFEEQFQLQVDAGQPYELTDYVAYVQGEVRRRMLPTISADAGV